MRKSISNFKNDVLKRFEKNTKRAEKVVDDSDAIMDTLYFVQLSSIVLSDKQLKQRFRLGIVSKEQKCWVKQLLTVVVEQNATFKKRALVASCGIFLYTHGRFVRYLLMLDDLISVMSDEQFAEQLCKKDCETSAKIHDATIKLQNKNAVIEKLSMEKSDDSEVQDLLNEVTKLQKDLAQARSETMTSYKINRRYLQKVQHLKKLQIRRLYGGNDVDATPLLAQIRGSDTQFCTALGLREKVHLAMDSIKSETGAMRHLREIRSECLRESFADVGELLGAMVRAM